MNLAGLGKILSAQIAGTNNNGVLRKSPQEE